MWLMQGRWRRAPGGGESWRDTLIDGEVWHRGEALPRCRQGAPRETRTERLEQWAAQGRGAVEGWRCIAFEGAGSWRVSEEAGLSGAVVRQAPGAELMGGVTLQVTPCEERGLWFGVAREGLHEGFGAEGWCEAVVRGLTAALSESGVWGVRIVLVEGLVHEVDSRASAFEQAARLTWQAGSAWLRDEEH